MSKRSFWDSIRGGHSRASSAELGKIKRAHERATRQRKRARVRAQIEARELRGELDDLSEQVEFLSLLLGATLSRLDDRGVLTREDLRELMIGIDDFDGELDGRLSVGALRELVSPSDEAEEEV